jgi:hypothetical protein
MKIHVVTAGDTLGRVAARYYGDPAGYPLIVAASEILDPDNLPPRLIIPDLEVAARAVEPADRANPDSAKQPSASTRNASLDSIRWWPPAPAR